MVAHIAPAQRPSFPPSPKRQPLAAGGSPSTWRPADVASWACARSTGVHPGETRPSVLPPWGRPQQPPPSLTLCGRTLRPSAAIAAAATHTPSRPLAACTPTCLLMLAAAAAACSRASAPRRRCRRTTPSTVAPALAPPAPPLARGAAPPPPARMTQPWRPRPAAWRCWFSPSRGKRWGPLNGTDRRRRGWGMVGRLCAVLTSPRQTVQQQRPCSWRRRGHQCVCFGARGCYVGLARNRGDDCMGLSRPDGRAALPPVSGQGPTARWIRLNGRLQVGTSSAAAAAASAATLGQGWSWSDQRIWWNTQRVVPR